MSLGILITSRSGSQQGAPDRAKDEAAKLRKQLEFLFHIKEGAAAGGINFDIEFNDAIHDRSIVTDSGWKILLGRGLDIFQYVPRDTFDLATTLQQFRQVKAFGVTYIREGA